MSAAERESYFYHISLNFHAECGSVLKFGWGGGDFTPCLVIVIIVIIIGIVVIIIIIIYVILFKSVCLFPSFYLLSFFLLSISLSHTHTHTHTHTV